MTEISKDSKYVARDKNGELWEYVEKPSKTPHGQWFAGSGVQTIVKETNDAFRNVRWEDDEPSPIRTGFNRLDDALNRDEVDRMRYARVIPVNSENPKVNKHKEITQLLNETYRAKNKDYGDAFGKTHEKYGAVSGLTRMSDKFYRIEELILSGEQLVDDESVLDTLLDLANYSIMLYMELEGEE